MNVNHISYFLFVNIVRKFHTFYSYNFAEIINICKSMLSSCYQFRLITHFHTQKNLRNKFIVKCDDNHLYHSIQFWSRILKHIASFTWTKFSDGWHGYSKLKCLRVWSMSNIIYRIHFDLIESNGVSIDWPQFLLDALEISNKTRCRWHGFINNNFNIQSISMRIR